MLILTAARSWCFPSFCCTLLCRISERANRSRNHGRLLFDTPTTVQTNTALLVAHFRPFNRAMFLGPKPTRTKEGKTQHCVAPQRRSAKLGHIVVCTSTAIHNIYIYIFANGYGGGQFYMLRSTRSANFFRCSVLCSLSMHVPSKGNVIVLVRPITAFILQMYTVCWQPLTQISFVGQEVSIFFTFSAHVSLKNMSTIWRHNRVIP